jgi:hypothetical protein
VGHKVAIYAMKRANNRKRRRFENFFVVTMVLKCLLPVSSLNPKIVKLEQGDGARLLCFCKDSNDLERIYSSYQLGSSIAIELIDTADEVRYSR